MASDLIDTTEMYVRTVWELEEEGITPIRARLTERLGLSAPSVSETVARLESDGLMTLEDDRTLQLTDKGRLLAESVMRKHRLAERLLVDVIGLEWEHVHNEACRWEHVISDQVEQKLTELLHHPTTCPHGNPIPGLADPSDPHLTTLLRAATGADGEAEVAVQRLSELLQADEEAMSFLAEHGVRPGASGTAQLGEGGVLVDVGAGPALIRRDRAQLIYVSQN